MIRHTTMLVALGTILAVAACGGSSGSGTSVDGTSPAGADGAGGVPDDGVRNGDETDVDCGGASAPKCEVGKGCNVGGDCTSGVCTGGTCAAPGPDDGVKNADETDVDCGGASAPKCEVGKGCAAHSDCASDACSYENECVAYKGCTAHAGGDTCGAGETGDPAAKHESCCTTIDVTDRPAGKGGAFSIDKYQVTAGRMRAFVERYNGDLQKWAATNPPGWDQAWTPKLPASMSDALYELGPGGKRGCYIKNQGGRTYWQGPVDGDAEEVSDFSQEVLDEKALNCVTWYMAQALCTWDGGRLANAAELKWVFENGGTTQFPWQFADPSPYNEDGADMRIVHQYSYQTPDPPATMRLVGKGKDAYPLDHAFWIAPPGRRPTGADKYGVMDAAGNMLMWIDDTPKYFTWTMSWEQHPKNLKPTKWDNPEGRDGYYALGARCARTK